MLPENALNWIAASLAARSELLRLSGLLHSVLEQNLSVETACEFKLTFEVKLSAAVPGIARALHLQSQEEARRFLRWLQVCMIGLYQMAFPTPVTRAAMAGEPRLAHMVNNAGYGMFGPLEAASRAQIQRQYDVNLFGLIECVQAIAPHFRANRTSVLINVSSIGGLMTVPGYSIYNSSKFAVEGLTEGLWYELGSFGIKVKLIEPGAIETNFSGRSMDMLDISEQPDYASFMGRLKAGRAKLIKNPGAPTLVAGHHLCRCKRSERPPSLPSRSRRQADVALTPLARVSRADAGSP